MGPTAPVLVSRVSGDFTIRPLSVTYLFHPLSTARADLYGGPLVAWLSYDSSSGIPERDPLDPEFAYGAALGVDVPFGHRWAGFLAARYLEILHSIESDRWRDRHLTRPLAVRRHRPLELARNAQSHRPCLC